MNRQIKINRLDAQIEKLKKERARLIEGFQEKKADACGICQEPLSIDRNYKKYCDSCSQMSRGMNHG
jgi:hypothetical protein